MYELLNKYGNNPKLTLIVFTLDETSYSRELAPTCWALPCNEIRARPGGFMMAFEGMTRYRNMVTETAGFYNTVGFNDDTRAFLSIPARHDLSRRIDSNYLGRLFARNIIDMDEAKELSYQLAYGLVKKAYKL